MPVTPHIRDYRSRGMTLIELLAVLVILGLLISVAVLSTGLAGRNNRTESGDALTAAAALSAAIEHVSQLALARNAVLGLRVAESGQMTWLRWQSPQWLPLDDSQLPRQIFPETVMLQSLSQSAAGDPETAVPTVVLYPGREMSVFEIHLRDKVPGSALVRVWPGANGTVQWGEQ